MKKICYATYDENFKELAIELYNQLNINIDIHVWGEHNLDYYEDTKVIIARGRTAKIIRETLDTPVVEIPISTEDILNAIVKASQLGSKIGIVGYDNIIGDIETLNPISNIQIYQRFARNEEDTYNQIIDLKQKGVKVIIGGSAQYKIAKKVGLDAIRLDLTEKSLKNAYSEASSILKTIEDVEKKNEKLNKILNSTSDAYIIVNNSNIISLINQKACSLKNIKNYKSPIGHKLTDIFPELNIIHEPNSIIKIMGRELIYDEIILLKNREHILEKMIKLTLVDDVRKADSKIRENIVNNGFKATYNFNDIIGLSPIMEQTKKTVKKFSKTSSTILLIGDTGVGKELFAQSIHNYSYRVNEPFVAINCGALPESLLESQLFGYEKGAFTGADIHGKKGAFELANKGTIFLDEISELSLNLQAIFLRALQEKQIVRLSGNKVHHIDVRVIAASNKNLKELVKKGLFREDLFYRLNVLPIKIPNLNNRSEDIHKLIKTFWSNKSNNLDLHITNSAYKLLLDYSWPGNVRQLENFIERLSILFDGNIVTSNYIKNIFETYEPLSEKDREILKTNISPDEIDEVVNFYNGNKSKASDALGIHRSTLWRITK